MRSKRCAVQNQGITLNNALGVILILSLLRKTETISFKFNHEVLLFYFYHVRGRVIHTACVRKRSSKPSRNDL